MVLSDADNPSRPPNALQVVFPVYPSLLDNEKEIICTVDRELLKDWDMGMRIRLTHFSDHGRLDWLLETIHREHKALIWSSMPLRSALLAFVIENMLLLPLREPKCGCDCLTYKNEYRAKCARELSRPGGSPLELFYTQVVLLRFYQLDEPQDCSGILFHVEQIVALAAPLKEMGALLSDSGKCWLQSLFLYTLSVAQHCFLDFRNDSTLLEKWGNLESILLQHNISRTPFLFINERIELRWRLGILSTRIVCEYIRFMEFLDALSLGVPAGIPLESLLQEFMQLLRIYEPAISIFLEETDTESILETDPNNMRDVFIQRVESYYFASSLAYTIQHPQSDGDDDWRIHICTAFERICNIRQARCVSSFNYEGIELVFPALILQISCRFEVSSGLLLACMVHLSCLGGLDSELGDLAVCFSSEFVKKIRKCSLWSQVWRLPVGKGYLWEYLMRSNLFYLSDHEFGQLEG